MKTNDFAKLFGVYDDCSHLICIGVCPIVETLQAQCQSSDSEVAHGVDGGGRWAQ